ncbi:MAG: hypothetical protein R3Y29_06590 [bacterium]
MSEADILELTYYDICDVYRSCKVVSEVGESIFKDDLVYESVKCGLSVSSVGSAGKLNQSKSIAITSADYQLFVRPEIDILPNDVVVITRFGKKITCIAGLSICYISHNHIPLKLKEEVV